MLKKRKIPNNDYENNIIRKKKMCAFFLGLVISLLLFGTEKSGFVKITKYY